jgi:ribosomal RNA-processing protein 9
VNSSNDFVEVSSEEEGLSHKREVELAEKRLKMAKEYLAKLGDKGQLKTGEACEDEEDDEIDAMECDRQILADRLRQDALQAKGKHFEKIADKYAFTASGHEVKKLRGHSQTPTCVAITKDGKTAFSGSKAGDIIKWNVETGEKIFRFAPGIRQKTVKKAGGAMPKGVKVIGHTNHILCIAVSFDGKFVASGGLDKTINIWDGHTHKHLAAFTQHRGPVNGLAFQYGTYQLYSCSSDRTIKIWGLDQLAYLDTLFGHQDAIPSIHTLAQERCVTVGSRDRTGRLWKISEESQLIFRASEDAGGSVETVQMLTEDHFVTGSDEGALSIWSVTKKKPFTTVRHESIYEDESMNHPIISLATVPFTDVLASGSDDGMIRFWKAGDGFKDLLSIGQIPMEGAVNGLAFSDAGHVLVAAVGREHRLGRWNVNKSVQNHITIIRFKNN